MLALYVVAMAIWIVDAPRLPEIAYAPWSTARGRLVLDAWGVPVESWAALVALPGVIVTIAGVTAAAWAVYLLLGLARVDGSQEVDAVVTPILVGTCVAAQLYRYVRVSGPIERQQAKWLMVAVGLWFVFAVTLNVTPLGTLYEEAGPSRN